MAQWFLNIGVMPPTQWEIAWAERIEGVETLAG